jgi:hypothetical protein
MAVRPMRAFHDPEGIRVVHSIHRSHRLLFRAAAPLDLVLRLLLSVRSRASPHTSQERKVGSYRVNAIACRDVLDLDGGTAGDSGMLR